MSDKSLSNKAIKIQGKDYVLVSDRIIYFNEQYPSGAILTTILSEPESDIVVVRARVVPDASVPEENQREFVGHSQAVKGAGFINKTAALENAETSAVGRALAMMGIGVIDSIASADEINKAKGTDNTLPELKKQVVDALNKAGMATAETMVRQIESVIGKPSIDSVAEARKVLDSLGQDN